MEEYLKPVPDDDAEGGTGDGGTTRKAAHAKAGKPIPTDRMKFAVQVEALRGFAHLSGPNKKTVTGTTLGQHLNIHPGTAALCNNFFAASGWIVKIGKGEYAATDALWSWYQAQSTGKPTAKEPLRDAAATSWYWTELGERLAATPMSTQEAVLLLMTEAKASPDHNVHLMNLIQWIGWVGLADVKDGTITVAANAATAGEKPGVDSAPIPVTVPSPPADTKVQESTTGKPGDAPVVLAQSFEVRLTAADLAQLSPEQITAVFGAVATIASVTSRKV